MCRFRWSTLATSEPGFRRTGIPKNARAELHACTPGRIQPSPSSKPEGFSRTCVLSWRAWRGLASPKELTRIPIENKALSTGSSLPESTSPPDWPPLLGEKQNGSRIGHPRHAKARQQDRLKKNKIAWLSPSFQHWPFLVTAPPNFLPSCFQLLARNATRIRSSLPITSKWKPGHTRPLNTNIKNTNQPRTPPEAQINANRQNAKKSTGPKTAEGKAASSRNRRRNRLLHGLRANKHILLDEDPAEFLFLLHDHLDRFQPVGPGEETLVLRIANDQWRLRRAFTMEPGIYRDRFHDVAQKEEFRQQQYTTKKGYAEQDEIGRASC